MIVICLTLGLNSVKALTIYIDNQPVNLPDLPNVSGKTEFMIYKCTNLNAGCFSSGSQYNLLMLSPLNTYYIEPYNSLMNFRANSNNYRASAYYIRNGNWYLDSSNIAYSSVFYTDIYASSINIYQNNLTTIAYPSGYGLTLSPFTITYEQEEVIMANYDNAIANAVTQNITLNDASIDINDYRFYYKLASTQEKTEYQIKSCQASWGCDYYYNIPLAYNTDILYTIEDNENNEIYSQQVTAYLSSLSDIFGYIMYDFRNYEFANMSNINNGSFGLSYLLNTNITINAINYNTNSKIDFLASNYLINSHTDNNGITWYDFDFNNEPIYLEFINNFNDTYDFYEFIDTYNLYLYFDNSAFIHLSDSPHSIETQDNIVNQSAYKDNQGNIIYNNNPVVINIDNSSEFFQNFQAFFKDFDNDTFGLTGIITSPLNLIQNLLTDTCNSLVIPIPYINSNLTLPCMSTIYSQYFGGFYILYQNITFGIVAYWVIVRILNMVKDFRNPDHDEIEVVDL